MRFQGENAAFNFLRRSVNALRKNSLSNGFCFVIKNSSSILFQMAFVLL